MEGQIYFIFVYCLFKRKEKENSSLIFFFENLELSMLVFCILLKLIVFVFEEFLILIMCCLYEFVNIWRKDVNLFLFIINL